MSERTFGEPRQLIKETQEPRWPMFDNVLKQVADPTKRAILRIAYTATKPLKFSNFKKSVVEFLAEEKVATSSFAVHLKDLTEAGLLMKDHSGGYQTTEIGTDFLAAFDRIREELSGPYQEVMK